MNQQSKTDYPLVLEAKHVKEILNLGLRQTYAFLQDPPFHVVRIGRNYKISKEIFFKWLNGMDEF